MKIIDRNGRIIEKKVGDFLYFKYKYIDSGGEWLKCTIEDIFEDEYINGYGFSYKIKINPEEKKKIIKNKYKCNSYYFFIRKEDAKKYTYTNIDDTFFIKT